MPQNNAERNCCGRTAWYTWGQARSFSCSRNGGAHKKYLENAQRYLLHSTKKIFGIQYTKLLPRLRHRVKRPWLVLCVLVFPALQDLKVRFCGKNFTSRGNILFSLPRERHDVSRNRQMQGFCERRRSRMSETARCARRSQSARGSPDSG